MKRSNIILALLLAIVTLSPFNALGWNIRGHMLSGAIAYQILRREAPTAISTVRSVLEKNPWYATRWKSQPEKLTESKRDEMLFLLAARWADDIRTRDPSESHPPWYYVDFPFKPESEPGSIRAIERPDENILTAIAENERIVRSGIEPGKRGIALSWLFLSLATSISRFMPCSCSRGKDPKDDEGGTETCVRVAQGRATLSLHQLWDELLTSSNNTRTITKMAIELRNRFHHPRDVLL